MLEERREMEDRIIRKAWRDPDFRARLASDPRATIEDELGVSIPDGVTVKVVEESADIGYLVLPRNAEDVELSEAEMGAIAGAGGRSHGGVCTVTYC